MTSVSERLEASRRIDWKYLLGEPLLRDVTVLEPVGEDLRTALETFADRFRPVSLDDIELGNPREPSSDLVVVPEATPRRLEIARELVSPGGWLYAEFPARSPSLLGNPNRLMAGFGSWQAYWVHPSHESPMAFTDLTSPGPSRSLVARHLRGPSRHLVDRLVRLPAVRRMLGPVAVVARREDPDPSRNNRETEHVTPSVIRVAGGEDPKGSLVMLTPSFSASRHVIGLIVDPERGSLERVVKTSRLEDDTQLVAEARGLTAVDDLTDPPLRPQLLSWGRSWGKRWLVQSAVIGEPMDRRMVSSNPDSCADGVTSWLRGLDRPGRSLPADDGRWNRLVEEPLGFLEHASPSDSPVRDLIPPTRALVKDLAHTELPVCFEHGDTRHPNIIVGPEGVGLVDWELARPEGFPLHDLSFFLEFVLESRSVSDPVARLVDPHSWAGLRLVAEARRRGIDPRLCGPLVLLALTRRTCDHFRRAGTVDRRASESWRSCLEALTGPTSSREVILR